MELLSTSEAAAKLNISRGRVLRLIAAGKLATQKIGETHVIRGEDLIEFAGHVRKAGRPNADLERTSIQISRMTLAIIDETRGSEPRSAWIRRAIDHEIQNADKQRK